MRNVSAPKAVAISWKQAQTCLKGRYFQWMAVMLVLILIRLIALSPLMTLVLLENGNPFRYLSLLTPILYFFVLLPLRYSTGEALRQALDGGALKPARFLDLTGYGQKLGAVLLQALHLLPWALPLVAGIGAGWYLMYGVEDGTVVLRMVKNLGGVLGEGHGFMEGIYLIAAFFGLLLLVLLYGMMRNGMLRFLWQKSGQKFALARKEMLARLKGRRGGQFWLGIIQSLMLLPAVLPMGYMGYRLLRDFSKYLRLDLSQLAEPQMLWGMAAALILIYWPLLPLRRALQACYIRRPEDGQ